MKERFKFRAWNKEAKTMHYSAEETYNGIFGKPKIEHTSFSGLLNDNQYIVMQSTGLKDRNGKLIYEGDIVKYTDCEGKETIGYLTIDRFNLLTFANMVNCDFCEEWADVVKAVFFTGNSTIEVIGNIYQDSHLLEN